MAGTLKIDMAQYRELEAFSQFSSDMDAVTAMTLDRGRKNNQLLIQPQYSPMPVGEQVAILYCGVHGLMRDVPSTRCATVRTSSSSQCGQPTRMSSTILQPVNFSTMIQRQSRRLWPTLQDNISKRRIN